MMSLAPGLLRRAWRFVRALAGDDAYERYRQHQESCPAPRPLMDRKTFYLHRQHQKWSGVNRCC